MFVTRILIVHFTYNIEKDSFSVNTDVNNNPLSRYTVTYTLSFHNMTTVFI